MWILISGVSVKGFVSAPSKIERVLGVSGEKSRQENELRPKFPQFSCLLGEFCHSLTNTHAFRAVTSSLFGIIGFSRALHAIELLPPLLAVNPSGLKGVDFDFGRDGARACQCAPFT